MLVVVQHSLQIVGEVEFGIRKIQGFAFMQDVCIFELIIDFTLDERALLLEVVLVVVMLKEVLVFLSDHAAILGVLDKHGHQRQHVNALEVEVVLTCKLELLVKAERNSLNFEVAIQQDHLLVLPVALQHRYELHLSGCLYEPFVELEARIDKASLCKGVYLLDLVEGLVIASSFLDPAEEQRMVEFDNGWRHQYVDRGVYNLVRFILKVPLEKFAHLSDHHLVLVAPCVNVARILLEEHDGVIEEIFLCGLVDEVVVSLEDGIVLDTIAEILNHRGLDLLIFNEDREADVIELPPSVDGEEIVDFAPLQGHAFHEFEVGVDDLDDFLEVHLVEGEVLPKELVPQDEDLNESLYLCKSLLGSYDLARTNRLIVQLFAKFVTLLNQVVLDANQSHLLIEIQVPHLQLYYHPQSSKHIFELQVVEFDEVNLEILVVFVLGQGAIIQALYVEFDEGGLTLRNLTYVAFLLLLRVVQFLDIGNALHILTSARIMLMQDPSYLAVQFLVFIRVLEFIKGKVHFVLEVPIGWDIALPSYSIEGRQEEEGGEDQ